MTGLHHEVTIRVRCPGQRGSHGQIPGVQEPAQVTPYTVQTIQAAPRDIILVYADPEVEGDTHRGSARSAASKWALLSGSAGSPRARWMSGSSGEVYAQSKARPLALAKAAAPWRPCTGAELNTMSSGMCKARAAGGPKCA